MNIKGSLPLLILHLLAQRPSHGYSLAKQIREQSDDFLNYSEGTLYPTLHGLEKQGLIESFEQEENGRGRRYYRLTAKGQKALASEKAEWKRYTQMVNLILGEAS